MSIFKSKKDPISVPAPDPSTDAAAAAGPEATPATLVEGQKSHGTIAAEENIPTEGVPNNDDEPAICQTSEHLKSYPMIKDVIDVEMFKAVRGTANPIFKPIGEWLHSQSLLKPIVQTTDGVVVSALESMERTIPCIKTTSWNDVGGSMIYPFKETYNAAENAKYATGDFMNVHILLPAKESIRKGRSYYNEHLYDTKGKPLLRSSLDPLFRPINYYIEDFTLKNLPNGEPVSNEYSSEIERGFWLTHDLMGRSKPVIGNEIIDGIMAPCNYTSHIFEVYNDNLAKHTGTGANIVNSSIQATYNTSVDLTAEWINESTNAWKKIRNKTPMAESQPIEQSSEEQSSE